MPKTTYEKLFGGRQRGGRPRLSDEERERNERIRKVEYRRKNEAKKRAYAVLAHENADKFETLVSEEYDGLAGDPKYDIALLDEDGRPKKATKSTSKK